MKIISTLSLFVALAILLYMNMGQVGSAYIDIRQARLEADQSMSHYPLSTLAISTGDISSGRATLTGRNEILYMGRLYDIASSSRHGDKIILKVLRDEKEEGLLANLRDIVNSWMDSPAKEHKQTQTKQLVIKDYIPAHKFAFIHPGTVHSVSPLRYTYPSQAPLLAVIKSPPKSA